MINYVLITKPGIILGNLVTFGAGFLLATRGSFHPLLFCMTLLGLAFIIASACVLNNTIDRFADQKMERTKNRSLATGSIKPRDAIFFAIVLAVIGNWILLTNTNELTVAVANVGFLIYVLIYSFIKEWTVHSTLIGSLAGAIPPVVGYTAVTNQLDFPAAILFLMMIFWQMPHFFSIALWHYEDYSRAGIPVLPVKEGIAKTKWQMVFYIIGLIPIVALFTLFGLTGILFFTATLAAGLIWLIYSLKGFQAESDSQWGRQMFRLSLLVINTICILLVFDLAS